MTAFANSPPARGTDGVPYCTAAPIPAAEGSLFNLSSPPFFDPVAVLYGEAVQAVVQLSLQGAIGSQSSYVVMQTDLGDDVWIDVAWLSWSSGPTGTATFVLSGGVAGANSFQQSRSVGTAPSPPNDARQFPMGGRLRFVGKATITASSSSSSSSARSSGAPAVTPAVLATIKYKQLGLR